MANGFWTKIGNHIASKPEVVLIAAATDMPTRYVVGCLVGLWCWVNEYGRPCENQPGWGEVSPSNIAALIHHCGENEQFWRTVEEQTKWIKIEPNRIAVPGYDDRFGDLQKKREQDAERKRQQRAREKGIHPTEEVTPPTAAKPKQTPVHQQQPWQADGTSLFDSLTPDSLKDPLLMLRWAVQVAMKERGKPNALCEHEEMHYVRVLAAAQHARSSNQIRAPLALFKRLIGGRKKLPIDPEHMRWAESWLKTLREEIRSKPEKLKEFPRETQLAFQFFATTGSK